MVRTKAGPKKGRDNKRLSPKSNNAETGAMIYWGYDYHLMGGFGGKIINFLGHIIKLTVWGVIIIYMSESWPQERERQQEIIAKVKQCREGKTGQETFYQSKNNQYICSSHRARLIL